MNVKWHNFWVVVVTWDHREQIFDVLDEVNAGIAYLQTARDCSIFLHEVLDTHCDQYALVISRFPLENTELQEIWELTEVQGS